MFPVEGFGLFAKSPGGFLNSLHVQKIGSWLAFDPSLSLYIQGFSIYHSYILV